MPVSFLLSGCDGAICSAVLGAGSEAAGPCDVDVPESWDVEGVVDLASAGLGRDLFRGSIMSELMAMKLPSTF